MAFRETKTSLVVVYTCLLSVAFIGPPLDYSQLTLLYRPVDYVGPIYSSQRGAGYLFFSGEPVQFEAKIFNSTERGLSMANGAHRPGAGVVSDQDAAADDR